MKSRLIAILAGIFLCFSAQAKDHDDNHAKDPAADISPKDAPSAIGSPDTGSVISSADSSPSLVSSLDTVTVYATRSPRSLFDVPAIVSDIDAGDAGNVLSGDIADLLEFTPGVSVEGGPRRTGQTVSIRGFDDESIITLVDGRRQNFESTHDGRFFLDPSLLKSVEIVKGASSAIYGGGAIGGVLAFETKDAADILKPGQSLGASGAFGYRSASNEFAPIVTAYGRSQGWDVLGSLAYRYTGNIKQGGSYRLNNENRIFSGLLKAGYTFADFHTAKFQFQSFNDNGMEPNNPQTAITGSNPLVDKSIADYQFSLKYAYDHPNNPWLKPKTHLYYNRSDVTETDLSGDNDGRVQSRDMETLGFTLDNQSRFDSHALSHILSYGFEIYRNQQTGKSSTESSGMRGGVPNASTVNYGFYAQDEVAWQGQAGKISLIPALRYDAYSSSAQADNLSQDADRVSPKIAVSYSPIDPFMMFGSWAKAFRAPNLTELYPIGQHFPAFCFSPPLPGGGCVGTPVNRFEPNPNLRPESVQTIEFGGGIKFGSLFGKNDRFAIKGSWHSSRGNDFISQHIDTPIGILPMAPAAAAQGQNRGQNQGQAQGQNRGGPPQQAGPRQAQAGPGQAQSRPPRQAPAVPPVAVPRQAQAGPPQQAGPGRAQGGPPQQAGPRQAQGGPPGAGGRGRPTLFAEDDQGTTRFINIRHATLTGWEVEASWNPDPVRITLGLSHLSAKNDETGEYLINSTPLTFVGDVRVLLADIDSVLGWRWRAAKSNKKVTTFDGQRFAPLGAKGYAVHDVYYRWQPDMPGWGELSLDLGIENIFDKAYARRFSTILEKGRSFAARMSYVW